MSFDHGQPIADWAAKQKDLTPDDRAAICALVGVRTAGDLRTVLERGDVPKDLAKKIERALKA